jgi:hypothetical protein
MSIINGVGRVGWKNYVSPISYLMDTYTGATLAYSLRKLSSTYSGDAIRVRRSSDNTEQNIGFDSNGNLNTSALLSFVGAGSGYVSTFYNQVGSNNLVQTVASYQPQIVDSGVLITKSNKPSIKYSTIQMFNFATPITGLQNSLYSIFMDYFKSTSGSNMVLLGNSAAGYYGWQYGWTDNATSQSPFNITATIPIQTHMVLNITCAGLPVAKSQLYVNSTKLGNDGIPYNGNGVSIDTLFYNGGGDYAKRVECYNSELVFFKGGQHQESIYNASPSIGNQTANRVGIEANQNSYYFPVVTYPTSLKLFIDAANRLSYSGTGSTVTDLTGTQNGTLLNGTSYNPADGGSFVFDGINDYITFGTNAAIKPTTRGTISIMAKVINTTADWNGVLFANNTFNLRKGVQIFAASKQNEYGNMVYYIGSDSTQNGQYFTPTAPSYVNLWKLFTLTWDGTNIKTYLNGVLFNTRVQTLTVTQELTSPTVLGQSLGGYPPLKGNISYLKIYDVARTQAEITTDFNEIKSRYGL